MPRPGSGCRLERSAESDRCQSATLRLAVAIGVLGRVAVTGPLSAYLDRRVLEQVPLLPSRPPPVSAPGHGCLGVSRKTACPSRSRRSTRSGAGPSGRRRGCSPVRRGGHDSARRGHRAFLSARRGCQAEDQDRGRAWPEGSGSVLRRLPSTRGPRAFRCAVSHFRPGSSRTSSRAC